MCNFNKQNVFKLELNIFIYCRNLIKKILKIIRERTKIKIYEIATDFYSARNNWSETYNVCHLRLALAVDRADYFFCLLDSSETILRFEISRKSKLLLWSSAGNRSILIFDIRL